MHRATLIRMILFGVCILAVTGVQAQDKGPLADQRVGPPLPPTERGGLNTYCSTPQLAIPDDDPIGASDTLNVPDSVLIADLNVSFAATHTWVGDLSVSIQGPGGSAIIIDRPGVPASTFGCSGDDYDCVIDDEAATPVENECGAGVPAIDGNFIGGDPANNTLLTVFDGGDVQGDWTITVVDNAGGDTGTLDQWCIIIEPVPVELMGFSVE